MSQLIAIKPLKEQLAQLIDDGDFQQAELLLVKNIQALEHYPAFLFQLQIEISLLRNGVEAVLNSLNQSQNLQEKYLIEGVINLSLQRYGDALEVLASALEKAPYDPLLCYFAGVACLEKGLLKEALQLFNVPGDNKLAESYLSMGQCYVSMDNLEMAYVSFEQSFERTQSDESLLTLLVFMRQQIFSDKLLDWGYVQRIRILLEEYGPQLQHNQRDVKVIDADLNLITGETATAITKMGKVLETYPDDEETRTNLAYTFLREGAFKEAYALNPSRKRNYSTKDEYKGTEGIPGWKGENLNGKSIIIFGEQGLGDRILLLRFLKNLTAKFKTQSVYVVIDQRLLSIVQRSQFRGVTFVSSEAERLELKGFDYKCYLSDLLFLLGPPVPPKKGLKSYLNVDKALVKQYKEKYKNKFPGLMTIGFTWKSSSPGLGSTKDLILRELGPLFRLQGVQWVSLQYGNVDEDIELFSRDHDCNVYVDHDVDHKYDLESSFAQVAAMDYVVTISNATAHICGALGIPAIVLLSRRAPWHWLHEGTSSCWYQSLSLVRQENANTWYPQLQAVSSFLVNKYKKVSQSSIITLGEVVALFLTARHELLQELLEKVPLSDLPHTHQSYLADLYLRSGEIKKCTDIVTPLLERGIESDQNLLLMAKAGRLLGKPKETANLLGLIKGSQYFEEVVLEKLLRALDSENYDDARKEWQNVLSFRPNIKNLDLLSAFLFSQREWITLRSYIPEERIDFCFEMLEGFDRTFGYRNPVVSIILRAELSSYKGDIDAGITGFRKALTLRPELSKMLNSSLGFCLLMKGEFIEGFKRHSAIRDVDKFIFSKDSVLYPEIPMLSEGEEKDENIRRILVTCEQGIGDQLLHFQFLRKFQKLFKKEIVLTASPKLVQTLRRTCPELIHVQAETERLPENIKKTIQRKVYLGNLTLSILNEFQDYQAEVDWFRADPEKVAYFKNKYASMFPGKKLVGLSWRSASSTWGSSKDVNLKSFLPILKDEDIQVISIQYADISKEVAQLGDDAGTVFLDPEVDITNDLESTFALIEALDSVLTISNVNAHFAGVLNKPGIVLLKARSLWHWLKDRSKAPWYPSLELVRENNFQTEEDMIKQIHDQLKGLEDS